MKKVAIAARTVTNTTGASRMILQHAQQLVQHGMDVTIFGIQLHREAIRATGATPHHIVELPFGSYAKRRFFAEAVNFFTRRGNFDLVWGHGDTLSQNILSLHNCVHTAAEYIHNKPLKPSSGVGRIHSKILQEKRFNLLIANSFLMKHDLEQRFQINPHLIEVIYPGYEPQKFNLSNREKNRQDFRNHLRLPKAVQIIGLISSGDFKKRGVSQFLDALALLPSELQEKIQPLVIGKELHITPYQHQAKGLPLKHPVLFLEPMPQVEKYYHSFDICVHPALFEEFGLVVQEAIICGAPVISSRRVGATELVPASHRQHAVLEEPTPQGLANSLAFWIKNENARTAWLSAVRPYYVENSASRHFQKIWELLESLTPRK